jgi:DNA-binding response OmpR family regulator
MKRILIIEDDSVILRGLKDNLESEHFEVLGESDGIKGYQTAKKGQFDIVILDIMLPSMNGMEICKQLRSDGVQTPILMLTSKGTELDKVMGLEIGADDYMTKPFSVRELIARINALLRRQSAIISEITEFSSDDIRLDFKKQEAWKGKKAIDLSAKEFELMKYFIQRQGQVVTRNELLDDVWGYEVTPTTRTIDNYILGLRKKIEKNPAHPVHLITVHTAGYKFVP